MPVAVKQGGTGAATAAGAVANLIGYQPARPVTGFMTGTSNLTLAAGQTNASIGSVGFTATATTVLVTATADVRASSASEFSMYLQLYNNSTNGIVSNGATSGCYVNNTANHGGNVCVLLAATGLVIGQNYAVTLLASATTANVTVNQSSLGGVNL